MAEATPAPNLFSASADLQKIKAHWPWFLALGIGMVALGTFAIGWACMATIV